MSNFVKYVRKNDHLYPFMVHMEWAGKDEKRRFKQTEVNALDWADRPLVTATYTFTSYTYKPVTRADLLASGLIYEAGHGQPCLTLQP